jgi:hypothetical protein
MAFSSFYLKVITGQYSGKSLQISVSREEEIGKIMVWGKKKVRPNFSKNLVMVACPCPPSYVRSRKCKGLITVQAGPGKNMRPSLKTHPNIQGWGRGWSGGAQENQPSKQKALSDTITAKKERSGTEITICFISV